jgi:hypothetical protein
LRKIDPPLLLTIRGAAAINVEQQLSLFEIHYKNMMTVVTDTEAAMISAGRLFIETVPG